MSLYTYQWDGVQWLRDLPRAYLADDMGLGKTVQAITAARFEQVKFPLTIAPASTIPNWRREIAKWWPAAPAWPIISYSRLIQPRWRGTLSRYRWDLVVLDEAHYCKSPDAKRTDAALTLAAAADRTWLLSGTPLPNHPGELWPPIAYVWPGVAERHGCEEYEDWLNEFTFWTTTKYGPRVYATKNADVLREELGRFMLRRRLRDVAVQLPPLRTTVHYLEKDVKDWEEMARHLRELGVVLSGVDSLEKVPDFPPEHMASLRRYLGAYKAPRVAKLIREELADDQYSKIVVLAHHLDTMEVLRRTLSRFGVVGFSGETPEDERQRAIDEFTDGGARVFLAQQTAAGVGINLQAASEVALVEPAWSPETNRQAVKRIHRIGQDRPCRARLFAVEGTLDEALMTRLAEKTQMVQEILG